MANIEFDFNKLTKKEQQGYLAMSEKQQASFEKKWVALQTSMAELNDKIVKANRRAKAKEAREKEAQRKADTHRKIENGALLESILKNHDAEFLIFKDDNQKENERLRSFLEYCIGTPYVKSKIKEMKKED